MKEKISLIFKILIVVVCCIGLYLNFNISSFRESVLYFTIQSNILCFIFYLIIIILKLNNKLKNNDLYYTLKGMVIIAITVTMIVYQIIVATSGIIEIYENNMLASNFVHLIVPIMVLIDYLFFDEKGSFKKIYPFIWSLIFIIYALFCIIYILFGGTFLNGDKYPYYYMNIEEYGLFKVLTNNIVLYIFFIIYGTFVQRLDNFLSKKKFK